ncbi:MAG: hypothetical protein OXI19_16885, partial [Gemmatimonadota bacterium]|nr:hypothetical protein [Gemmatimonadota bacterium]
MQCEKGRRDRSGQPVVGEVQQYQCGQVAQRNGNGSGKLIAAEVQDCQRREVAQCGRDRTGQPVAGET